MHCHWALQAECSGLYFTQIRVYLRMSVLQFSCSIGVEIDCKWAEAKSEDLQWNLKPQTGENGISQYLQVRSYPHLKLKLKAPNKSIQVKKTS